MLKRIFWAATITIPLYFAITLENTSKQKNVGEQIIQQPQQLLGYLQRKLNNYQQELEDVPHRSVNLDMREE